MLPDSFADKDPHLSSSKDSNTCSQQTNAGSSENKLSWAISDYNGWGHSIKISSVFKKLQSAIS